MWALANGPFDLTSYYNGCIVNEVRFHTKDHEARRTTQNSGVLVEGVDKMEYYGFVDGVVELVYLGGRKVVLFLCEWFDTSKRTGNRRTIQDDKHYISIDKRSRWYSQEPFVLPTHVQQVFYLNDTKLGENWQVVQRVYHRHLWDLPVNNEVEERDVGNSSFQNPMQQYESEGIATIGDNNVDDAIDLVRKDVEPDVIDMEEFIKIRQENKSAEDEVGGDDERDFDLEQMEDSEHFIGEEDFELFEEMDPDEMHATDDCHSEEEDFEGPKRKKRRCKCHI